MKTLKGYLTAATLLACTAIMTFLAQRYGQLLDTFYPYVTRQIQAQLASLTASLPYTLWQTAVVCMGIALVGSILLMLIFRWKFFRWLGWVLALCSLLWSLHTGLYGLNFYASPLSEDLRMEQREIDTEDLKAATAYFRDKANEMAQQLPRDAQGDLIFDSFENLALQAGNGYQNLVAQGESVFAGSTLPVKRLDWADMYTSMGICGVTMAITGEAAVNPQIPVMSLPYVMCHEMAHRMCIAMENDANFAAFLACTANDNLHHQYSGYYMAYRYCYNELYRHDKAALGEIHRQVNEAFRHDLKAYDEFFSRKQNETATKVATTANNAYIQASGDKAGVASYGQVATQLTSWYLELMDKQQTQQEQPFNPLDKDNIDDILGEK